MGQDRGDPNLPLLIARYVIIADSDLGNYRNLYTGQQVTRPGHAVPVARGRQEVTLQVAMATRLVAWGLLRYNSSIENKQKHSSNVHSLDG